MVEPRAGTEFIAECFWPDVREDDVAAAAARLRAFTADASGGGALVEFEGSILVPRDEVVFYLFRAGSADVVREACIGAEIPVERVLASVWQGPTGGFARIGSRQTKEPTR